jgi:hypothetical protein
MATHIDIFVRTYFRDFRWLALSLLSIVKFVEGYRRIVIVMPGSSLERLRGGEIPASARAITLGCGEYANDYLGQQVSKLYADCSTDASLIVHVDSDCMFRDPCSLPALLTTNGRPVIRMLLRSRRQASDGWRRCIADFYGEPLPFDVLAPPPYIYSRNLYGNLRRYCKIRHGVELDEWCLSRQLDSVSEFGLLAAQAWFHHRHEYCWIEADDEAGWPCHAYWSRTPGAAKQLADLANKLRCNDDGIRADTINAPVFNYLEPG